MDAQIVICYVLGLFCLYIHTCCVLSLKTGRLRTFLDNDQRTRNKRNAEHTNLSTIANTSEHGVGVVDVATIKPVVTTSHNWMQDILNGIYYGSEDYLQRKAFKENPKKKPTICYNNITLDKYGIRLTHFICPMENETDSMVYCCGEEPAQRCCSKAEHDPVKKSEDKKVDDDKATKDVVAGISIAAGFVVSLTCCMFLYCCCCQRRHEIHDGVKLMWVRRSFGKELTRLEQPAYQDHMTVVNSITGIRESRHPSRQGSRQPSRQGSLRSNRSRRGSFILGSRNPSVNPSPSISRRASHDPHVNNHQKQHIGTAERHHLGLDVPTNVVITVTTPSDEQGPSAPLLKIAQQESNPV